MRKKDSMKDRIGNGIFNAVNMKMSAPIETFDKKGANKYLIFD